MATVRYPNAFAAYPTCVPARVTLYICQLRVGYYGAITYMDRQIDRIISALVEQKLVEELDGREEGYSDGAQLIVERPSQTVLEGISC